MGDLGIEKAAAAAAAEIVKARTDKREYRRIVLKNSLEVLLISNPETDKMAGKLVKIKLHTWRSQRVVKESRSLCTCDCRHAEMISSDCNCL